MKIRYCDTCGKKTERLHDVTTPVGAEEIVRAGMSSYVQMLDGKLSPMMGRSNVTEVCIDCLSAIEVNNVRFIKDLKENNKDALEKLKIKYEDKCDGQN